MIAPTPVPNAFALAKGSQPAPSSCMRHVNGLDPETFAKLFPWRKLGCRRLSTALPLLMLTSELVQQPCLGWLGRIIRSSLQSQGVQQRIHADTYLSIALSQHPACTHTRFLPATAITDFSVDLNFRLLQAGQGLQKMLPQLAQPGIHIGEVLTVSRAWS